MSRTRKRRCANSANRVGRNDLCGATPAIQRLCHAHGEAGEDRAEGGCIPILSAQWISIIANHLWQSTAVTAAVALLNILLRNNHARMRYHLWLIASIKFPFPFAL